MYKRQAEEEAGDALADEAPAPDEPAPAAESHAEPEPELEPEPEPEPEAAEEASEGNGARADDYVPMSEWLDEIEA